MLANVPIDCHYIQEPDTPSGYSRRRKDPLVTTYSSLAAYLRARFSNNECGASLVEYALLLALFAVVLIVAVSFLGKDASSKGK